MTTGNPVFSEIIANPAWGHIRTGDLVTIEKGKPGTDGHTMLTARVRMVEGAPMLAQRDALTLMTEYRVVKIERETSGPPLPAYAGAIVLTDEGIRIKTRMKMNEWVGLDIKKPSALYSETHPEGLINPIEALPVPAHTLRKLHAATKKRNVGEKERQAFEEALFDFFVETGREWERAGIEGTLDEKGHDEGKDRG